MRIAVVVVLLFACALCANASPLDPVFKNAGFEDEGAGVPSWEWYPGSGAACGVDTNSPHSGSKCLVFTNGVERAINENFGRFQQWAGILPGMEYEFSAWVRGENVQPGNFFTDWCNFRMDIPSGTYGWKRVSKVYYAQNYLSWVNFGMNVSGPAKSFAIDDITLRPVGLPVVGKGVSGSYITPGRVDGDDKATPIRVSIKSALPSDATLEASIKAAGKTVFSKSGAVKPGESVVEWEWNSGKVTSRSLTFLLRVIDANGRVVASAKKPVEKVSTGILLADIDALEKRLQGEFAALLAKCKARGLAVDYPMATKTMVTQFIPLTRADAKDDQRRACLSIKDMQDSLTASIAEMRQCLANPKLARAAVRYKTGKLDIDGLSVVGERVGADGKASRGPLFFCGYGHFYQARNDIPLFPGYGVNIIQSSEFGPSAVLPAENEVNYDAINTLIKTLDNAAKHNVRVDVLISPHYFPMWPLAKWPQLSTGGFVGYCVDLPEAKYFNEKFLRILVPMIKDKPALNSLCLTNEPAFDGSFGASNTKPMWADYLAKRYGDVKTLNDRYGTTYASLAEVPMGGGGNDPQFYDWCMFNRTRFSDWHRWVADVIHEMAPDLPVHSKLCSIVTLPSRAYSGNGVDFEMMGRVSGFNGNDCCFYNRMNGEFASEWQLQNVVYDIQRSLNRKPIFNSENHISRDFSMNYVPADHFRTVLWQGAIHGQAQTTIWIWERATSNPGSYCFYGNVMDRPGCALAVGETCMDLNRFSAEVTALQNAKAPVAIVYSNASFMRQPDYVEAMNRAYEALNFCGVKVDFISELQLARGDGAKYRMIVAPLVTHITDDALKGLLALPQATRFVVIGGSPASDPYNKAIPEADAKRLRDRAMIIDGSASSRAIWTKLRSELSALGALPEWQVVDAGTGEPVWGIEWLSAKVAGRTVMNMVNLTGQPVEVRILAGARGVRATNLLSVGARQNVRVLEPESPVLAAWE